jgi:hypothetical protein
MTSAIVFVIGMIAGAYAHYVTTKATVMPDNYQEDQDLEKNS